ncbi:MAG: carboxypeptidase-like regulatory domain-containing protein [Bacteroidota bacterium]
MKRLLFMIAPLAILMLAFRPITTSTVTGKINDEKGNPVAGATIQVKGTAQATTSLPDGTFSISTPQSKAVLVITAVGYKATQVTINGQSVINVTLKIAESKLEEVVVIGYGAAKVKQLTNAGVYRSGGPQCYTGLL